VSLLDTDDESLDGKHRLLPESERTYMHVKANVERCFWKVSGPFESRL
jgi:hypothetical protein